MSEFQQFEKYFFSENKENFINKLIVGTDQFYYFQLLYTLNKYGLDLSIENEKHLENFKKLNTQRFKNIKLRTMFMGLEKQGITEEKIKSLIQEINKDFLGLNFNYDQPRIVSTTSDLVTTKIELSNCLDNKLIDKDSIIEESYSNLTKFKQLKKEGFEFIDLKRLSNLDYDFNFYFLSKITNLYDFEYVPELIKNFYERWPKRPIFNKIWVFKQMSLNQFKELQKIHQAINKDMEFIGE